MVMLAIALGNYEAGSGEVALTNAATEMISSLASLQKRIGAGESVAGVSDELAGALCAIDFGDFKMRLMPGGDGRVVMVLE